MMMSLVATTTKDPPSTRRGGNGSGRVCALEGKCMSVLRFFFFYSYKCVLLVFIFEWWRSTFLVRGAHTFFSVKKLRRLGSSPRLSPTAGSVCDRDCVPAASCSHTAFSVFTHWRISASLRAWNRNSAPLASLTRSTNFFLV